jgi:integrase
MSLIGSKTTSDYIDFDRATAVGFKLIKENKKPIFGLYIIVSINTGLRISDVLNLKWTDLEGDCLKLNEKKTGKYRTIQINDAIKKAISKFEKGAGYIFLSQKGSVYSRQQINKLLKQLFSRQAKTLNVSSHSLRKSFGKHVFTIFNESDKSLIYLSELFNHTSPAITRQYLGIRQEELNDIYLNL